MDEDSLSSDSSSDSEEEVGQEELKQQISLMRKQIESNNLDYDAHVNLIALLRKSGDLEELRDARKNMNKVYPLSPALWMDWVSDEQKICTTQEERNSIVELFEKAVLEYTSVKVWVEYIMFMLGGGHNAELQKVCERALTAVGIHVSEGALAWQAVLLVEQQVFANLKEEGNQAKIGEQKKRLQSLYRRHALVPLLDVDEEEFVKEAAVWFDGQIDAQMKRDIEKTAKKLQEKLPFELSIIQAEDELSKLEAYRKYLDHVLSKDNPSVIQNTYERTLTDLCLNAGIWEEYVRFAINQFPYADYAVLPVCERSQRNCPWSSDLCCLHIAALQKFADTMTKEDLMRRIKGCLETTLGSGLCDGNELVKAWMAYLVYLRRNVKWDEENSPTLIQFREACEQAMHHLEQACPELADPEGEIPRFQAKVEAQLARNMEGARALWRDCVMQRNDNFKNPILWLEFINLERSYGDEKHCRKLFFQALERVWDSVEVIVKAFLKYEQEIGTLDTMEKFEKRCRDRLAIVMRKRMEDSVKKEAERISKENRQNSKIKKDRKKSPLKPGSFQQEMDTTPAPPTASTSKLVPKEEFKKPFPLQPKTTQEDVSPPPGYKRPAPGDTLEKENRKKPKVESSHGEFVQHDSSKDFRSVFLSNLDYSTKEESILPVFKDCGPIEEFRLAKDYKGRSKGFGYLIFEGPSSLPKALLLDRTPIGTRPLFVSPCDPSKRGTTFRFSTGLEKDKLFVRGLPCSMSEQEVKAVFAKHAPIKDIRLVTHRNGYSKGICYIQFHDEEAAEEVRQKTDGTFLEGFKMTVQISNPSASKAPKLDSSSARPLPAGPSRTNARQKLAFVPRALARRGNDKAAPSSSLNGNSKAAENGSNDDHSAPKSNEDFRKMLLK